MVWAPISEVGLSELIIKAVSGLDTTNGRLWKLIRLKPEKWQCHPWGDKGGGFWVVGLIGEQVIWYNDIEDGFNISHYDKIGEISEYWCNQDELQHTLYGLFDKIQTGNEPMKLGPPETFNSRS
jgi:hypothetical protein